MTDTKCAAVFPLRSGNIVRCARHDEHAGEHENSENGFRLRWSDRLYDLLRGDRTWIAADDDPPELEVPC